MVFLPWETQAVGSIWPYTNVGLHVLLKKVIAQAFISSIDGVRVPEAHIFMGLAMQNGNMEV